MASPAHVVIARPCDRNGRDREPGDGEQNDKPDDEFDFREAHKITPVLSVSLIFEQR